VLTFSSALFFISVDFLFYQKQSSGVSPMFSLRGLGLPKGQRPKWRRRAAFWLIWRRWMPACDRVIKRKMLAQHEKAK